MADEAQLFVFIDAADRNTRIKNRGWQDYFSLRRTAANGKADNCWIDPVGGAVMLQPLQLLPDFRDAGNTVPRLPLSSFTKTSGGWEQVVFNPVLSTDYWMFSDGTPYATLSTNTTFEKNQAFYFSMYVFSGPSDNCVQCELTFGGYTLRIHSDGCSYLYKDSVLKDGGYLTPGPTDMSGKCLDILIIPYKRDSILFWSPTGGCGWVYRNIEMIAWDWSDTSEITAAGKCIIAFPNTAARFQLMPVRYADEGTFFTGVMQSILPPTAEQQTDSRFSTRWDHDDSPNGHTSGVVGTLWNAAMTGTFTADGTTRGYTGRWSLIGDGKWTPFVYSLTVNWPSITQSGAVDELDISDDVTKLSINIAEDASQSSATLTLRFAESKYPNLARKTGRHCLIKFGTMEIFWGVMRMPVFRMRVNDLSEYDITIDSIFRWFELPNLPASGAWDGYEHTEFMKWMVTCDDFTEDDISFPTGLQLPLPGQVTKDSDGQWMPEAGDSKKSWINKVLDITGWVFDDCPIAGRMKLRYISPDDIVPVTQPMYVFSVENPNDYKTWIRSLYQDGEEPEGTQVWMVGCTEDTKEIMAAVYIDYTAEDGTLMEEDRPANWMGRVLPIKLSVGNVKSMADLEKLAYYVGKDVTRCKIRCEINAEYILGLWRFDRISFLGETWKITAIDIECVRECADFTLRPTTYQLELVQ